MKIRTLTLTLRVKASKNENTRKEFTLKTKEYNGKKEIYHFDDSFLYAIQAFINRIN